MTGTKLQFVTETETLSVQERKKRLRAYMKERRGQNENRDLKERALIDNFLQVIDKIEGAGARRSYFIYLSFSSEAPTDGLIEIFLQRGQAIYCPRIENGQMTAVLYGEDFTLSKQGIREPVGQAFDGDTDYIILPLLAVDEQGNRLGYGGGYYDRYLSQHKKAKRIAYGYDFQVINEVPTENTDEKADIIVTDKRILTISNLSNK